MKKFLLTPVLAAACAVSAAPPTASPAKERSVTMFMALNGSPTVADVERKLSALAAGGVNSFMLYPTSGLKLDYLGREFFDIARASGSVPAISVPSAGETSRGMCRMISGENVSCWRSAFIRRWRRFSVLRRLSARNITVRTSNVRADFLPFPNGVSGRFR